MQIRPPLSSLLVMFLLAVVPRAAAAQAIRGTVIDELLARPIPQANVSVLAAANDSVIARQVAATGAFVIDVPEPGIYRVRVDVLGYTTFTSQAVAVARGTLVTIELRLRANAIALQPLRVVAERDEPVFMRDVRRRERSGFGNVMTRDDLDERIGSDLRAVLSTQPGLRMTTVDGASVIETRGAAVLGRACYATVYLNGVRQFSVDQIEDPDRRAIVVEKMKEIFTFRPGELEAIEVYRSAAEVPAEYSGSTAQCGVVAIWLRSGFERDSGDLASGAPLKFGAVATATTLSGSTKTLTGFGVEGSAHLAVRGKLAIGLLLSRAQHTLPNETMDFYTAGLDPESVVLPSGARPMTLDAASIEFRLTFRNGERVQPIIAPRMQIMRRYFELVDAKVERRTTRIEADGSAFGLSAGMLARVSRRGVLHTGALAQRMSFAPYSILERETKRTASDWNAFSFKLGFSYEIGGP